MIVTPVCVHSYYAAGSLTFLLPESSRIVLSLQQKLGVVKGVPDVACLD